MTKPQQTSSTTAAEKLQAIATGTALLLMLHLLAIAGLWILLYLADLLFYITSGVANSTATQQLYQVWVFTLLTFGLVQWLYVLPVVWWLSQQNKAGLVQGVMAGAIATSLLNGGYFLLGLPLPLP